MTEGIFPSGTFPSQSLRQPSALAEMMYDESVRGSGNGAMVEIGKPVEEEQVRPRGRTAEQPGVSWVVEQQQAKDAAPAWPGMPGLGDDAGDCWVQLTCSYRLRSSWSNTESVANDA